MLRNGTKHGLTPKELGILFLLANGFTQREIGKLFRLAGGTMGTYTARIRWWLRAKTNYEAVSHFKSEAQGTWLWEHLTQQWQPLLSKRNSLRPVRLGLYPRAYLHAVRLPEQKRNYAVSPLSAVAAKSSIDFFTRQVSPESSASLPTSASTDHLRTR